MAIGDWRSHVIRKSAAAYLGREGFGGTGSNLDSMDRTQLQNLVRAANDRYNPKIKQLEALVTTRVKGGDAYNRAKNELDQLKNQRDNQIAPAVQRLKSQRATPKQQNWQQMLKPNVQSAGSQQPATSVVDATRNVPPAPNLPPIEGEKPADLAGFARQKGYMGQQPPQQNVPKQRTGPPPKKPPTKTSAQLNQEAQQRKVTQEATQAASQPSQRTGPPPKKMTTAQLNQQAQQRRQQQSNNPPPPPSDAQGNPIPPKEMPSINQQLIQQNKRMNEKYLRELGTTATTPRQRRRDAKQQKQQAKQQARQQKTQQRMAQQQQRQQEKEAKRQAKQNPRGGGQLVPRGTGRRQNPALVPRGTGRRQNPVLRPKQTGVPIGKSDEFSKSIKDILRR